MPKGGSNVTAIPAVMETLIQLNPRSVIDIGAGLGKYGVLCKEYLDLYLLDYLDPDPLKNDWIFEIYDHRNFEKIQDFIFATDYDVALLIAVMCKFTKEEGYEMLAKIRTHCKHIVLTIEKEQHGGQTQWTPEDFPKSVLLKELPYEWMILL